ncbi:MAG TPA: radical SAM family heme chaperone HemW [Rhizomicrobium sp.]|jgi:oxygen-independent coproporphyrinogen-3 oxidase|nr:radical SAM family heme chaperone HemW [Rhizomicrobium sp.]
MTAEPFGVYIHWPFCAAKCPYCDFNSHVRTEIEEAGWATAIERELAYVASELVSTRDPVTSIFFGGGTPSLMSGRAVGAALDAVAHHWPVAEGVEITLEANPSSVEAGRFRDYREAGVNRVSLGVQALNDRDLKFLGRIHDVAEARGAVKVAQSVFDRVSVDLIYGRPHQAPAEWRAELQEAIDLGTDHLSLYQLTIEDNTPFAALARSGALKPLVDDSAADLYELTQEVTEQAGLAAYEISNHARPGSECQHNLLYWRYGDYAGVGPGAHGRLGNDRRRVATICEKLPERWMDRVAREGHGIVEMTEISAADAAREHLIMGMRLAEGLDPADYTRRWGAGISADRVRALVKDGLIEIRGNRLAATAQGRLVLNAIIAALTDQSAEQLAVVH